MKKYNLTSNTKVVEGHTLYQIKHCETGELGGWIESEKNLSQEGNAWVFGGALVFGNAWVYDNALVFDNAWVYGNALVFDNAWVFGSAQVSGSARVFSNALVSGYARISNVFDNVQFPELKKIEAYPNLKYSVIEYKLAHLYQNQEIIYQLLRKIYAEVSNKTS